MNNLVTTNFIRKLDNLGRVQIPKEIRQKLSLKEDDAFEIYTNDDTVAFKKNSNLQNLKDSAKTICKVVQRTCNLQLAVADNENIVYLPSTYRCLIGDSLDETYIRMVQTRISQKSNIRLMGQTLYLDIANEIPVKAVLPLILDNKLVGSVAVIGEPDTLNNDLEFFSARIVAEFIIRQLEI